MTMKFLSSGVRIAFLAICGFAMSPINVLAEGQLTLADSLRFDMGEEGELPRHRRMGQDTRPGRTAERILDDHVGAYCAAAARTGSQGHKDRGRRPSGLRAVWTRLEEKESVV